MKRWSLLLLILILGLSLPVTAAAQDEPLANRDQEFAASINDPLIVRAEERVAVAMAIHNESIVDGTIVDVIFVIDGVLTVNGTVQGDIVAFSSRIILGPDAWVNNISLHNSTVEVDPGAVVNGRTEIRGNFFLLEWWSSPVFALVFWVLSTLFLMAGGVIFTLASGQQYPVFVSAASRHIGRNLLTSLIVWIGIPILAVLVMVTIIGIPLGLVMLGLVLPGLWWLGYTVVGARLGSLVLKPVARRHSTALAIASTMLGIIALQLLTLLPYVGGMAIFLAGAYGSGVLVYHLMRGRHDRPIDPELADIGPELSRASADLRLRN